VAILAETLSRNCALFGAILLTFVFCRGAFAELAIEGSDKGVTGSPTRIKRDGKNERKKPSGYHNRVGSPSRVAGDESYLLVAEEPKPTKRRPAVGLKRINCRKFYPFSRPAISPKPCKC
jgi:hypothetical protein